MSRHSLRYLPMTNKLKCHVVSRHLPEIFTPPAPHTYRSKAYIREITLPHSDPGLSVICLCVITAAPAAYHSHSQTPVQVDLLTRFPPPDGGVETSLGRTCDALGKYECHVMSQHLPGTNKLKCHVVSRHLPEEFHEYETSTFAYTQLNI